MKALPWHYYSALSQRSDVQTPTIPDPRAPSMPLRQTNAQIMKLQNISIILILLILDGSTYVNFFRYGLRIFVGFVRKLIAQWLSEVTDPTSHESNIPKDIKRACIYLALAILSHYVLIPRRREVVRRGVVDLFNIFPVFASRYAVWVNTPRHDEPGPEENVVVQVLRRENIRLMAENLRLRPRAPPRVPPKTSRQEQYKKEVHRKRTFTWNTTSQIAEATQQVWRQVPGEEVELLGNIDEDNLNCSICWAAYDVGDKVTILPCEHCFHETCLEPWFKNHFSCPKCTRELVWELAVKK